jgi:hypothetical protein
LTVFENPSRGAGVEPDWHATAHSREIFAADYGLDSLTLKKAFDKVSFSRMASDEDPFHGIPSWVT